MKNIVKTVAVISLALLMALSFAACGKGGDNSQPKEFDVAKLAKDIFDNCKFEDQYLTELPDKSFALSSYNIDASLVAEENGEKLVVSYVSSAYPEMIFVAKSPDKDAAGKVMGALKELVAKYIKDYTNYGPEQISKLESAVGREVGEYVIMVVSNDNTAAAAYIDSIIK